MSLLLENHVFGVLANQSKLYALLGEKSWNWGVDMQLGKLSFTRSRKAGLLRRNQQTELLATCPIQLLGSESHLNHSWFWAWANHASHFSASLLTGIAKVKAEAERENSSFYLAQQPFPLKYPQFGTEMAIICTGFLRLFTYFACPYDNGVLYVAIQTLPEAERLTLNAMQVIHVLTAGVQSLDFNHRKAVLAYLGQPISQHELQCVWHIGKEELEVRFDSLGRIADMSTTVHPPR